MESDLKKLRKDLRYSRAEIKNLSGLAQSRYNEIWKLKQEVKDLKPYKVTFDKCNAVMDLTSIYNNEMSDKRLAELNKNKFNMFAERFNNLIKRLIRKRLE